MSINLTTSCMEQITFWIAVVGFALSVYNFVAALVANSERLLIKAKHICIENGVMGMVLEITNKSRLGISITGGKLILDKTQQIPFGETSTLALVKKLPYEDNETVIRAGLFPIRLESLCSVRVFMQTEYWNHDVSTCSSCDVLLSTSRGGTKHTVELPSPEHGLQLLRYLG